MPALTFEALKDEYAQLWASMEIRPSKAADIDATASKIAAKKTRYKAVEKETGVPWYVVGVIHAMEGGCDFATHLHNGDSLAKRTAQVPSGRPAQGDPPFTWKASACDALTMKGLEKIVDWSIERISFELERYNGFGYRTYHPNTLSPYLWSGTNHYSRGKYVADGKWSASAVSGQSGAMAILKRLMDADDSVRPEVLVADAPSIEEHVSSPSVAFPRTPEPTDKVVGSRKIATANAGETTVVGGGLGLAALIAYAKEGAEFVKTYGIEIAVLAGFVICIYFAAIKHFTRQDHAEGRYTPSGDAK